MTSRALRITASTASASPQLSSGSPPVGLKVPAVEELRDVLDVPRSTAKPAPAYWLLGAHGGSGTSTLTASWAPAADAQGAWPAADTHPSVVVVARTHRTGLNAAHVLLRQAAAGLIGRARLLGLVTIADHDGPLPALLRRQLGLVEELAPHGWRLPFIPEFRCASADQLPQWSPRDEPAAEPRKRFARRPDPTVTVHPAIAETGAEIFAAARAAATR
ncbi:DUF6668 family protein [Nocardia asteroides]|uniref:DUF6668 family protein n=1 Tax=Nocardia asteroides TaxID=1824 RepID=UPI0037C5B133